MAVLAVDRPVPAVVINHSAVDARWRLRGRLADHSFTPLAAPALRTNTAVVFDFVHTGGSVSTGVGGAVVKVCKRAIYFCI